MIVKKEGIFELINFCIARREALCPKYSVTHRELHHDMKLVEECVDAVSRVLMTDGFEEDGEPNALGHQLEEAIDFLNNILYTNEKPKS